MADEEDDGPRPAGAGSRSEAAASGCVLLAGIAFALVAGPVWLLLGAGPAGCAPGSPCPVHSSSGDWILVGLVAAASGAYAVGVRALLRRPGPPGPGRKPRPPRWAALTGLTLFALTVGGWLAPLAMALLGRQL